MQGSARNGSGLRGRRGAADQGSAAAMDSRALGYGGLGLSSAGTRYSGTGSGLLWARRLCRVRALGHTGARQGSGNSARLWCG